MKVSLESPDGIDEASYNFGFREFKANGTRFEINGQPVFLRGTLECCIFPLTGYPAMQNDYWAKIYRTCKEYGLNHVRFHSWCLRKPLSMWLTVWESTCKWNAVDGRKSVAANRRISG